MLYDIIEVKVVKDYVIRLRFENGVEGEIDVSTLVPFQGIFAQLEDTDYFATVQVNSNLGTIVWDNGADLSPEYLYAIISNEAA